MKRISTKATAESVLRELPSVLGAFVQEDVNGHPREVHLLVAPGPDPRHLARDVRSLLEERIGVRVDQRVISIAQLAAPLDFLPQAGPEPTPPAPEPPPSPFSEPRLAYLGLESLVRNGRVQVQVRVSWRDKEHVGEGAEVDGGQGRIRAAASAALCAASRACGERIRLELEAASPERALGRDYILVSALAASPLLGRRPLALAGAHPAEDGAEMAAALAALHASNRVLGLALRGTTPTS